MALNRPAKIIINLAGDVMIGERFLIENIVNYF